MHHRAYIIESARPQQIVIRGAGSPGQSAVFEFKPDDDYTIYVGGRVAVADRRNVGWYDDPTWSYEGPMEVGELVEVYVFDGWRQGWAAKRWTCQILYENGEVLDLEGGDTVTGSTPDSMPERTDQTSNYFNTGPHFEYEIFNGAFLIPPSPPLPIPRETKEGFRLCNLATVTV